MKNIIKHTAVVSLMVFGLLSGTSLAEENDALRDIVVVGNNWDGTANLFYTENFEPIKRINIVPDRSNKTLARNYVISFLSESV